MRSSVSGLAGSSRIALLAGAAGFALMAPGADDMDDNGDGVFGGDMFVAVVACIFAYNPRLKLL